MQSILNWDQIVVKLPELSETTGLAGKELDSG
jgi:hypothetical protein